MHFIDKFVLINGHEVDSSRPISPIPLVEKKDLFYEHLKNHEYCKAALEYYQYVIKKVCTCTTPRGLERYDEVAKTLKKCNRGRLARIMMFDLYDELNENGLCIHDRKRAGKYYSLNKNYRVMVDDLMKLYGHQKTSSQWSNARVFMSFLFHMQEKGYADLSPVTIDDVIEFAGTGENSNRTLRSLAHRLKFYGEEYHNVDCIRISSMFLVHKGMKEIFNAFSEKEADAVSRLITEGTDLSLLEKAVGLLMEDYGMRGCDIKNLKLADIKWDSGSIEFIQCKTGVFVSLPLMPAVGNAIMKYIKYERPKVKSPYCFLSPHKRKGKHAQIEPHRIAKRIYLKAGINLKRGRLGLGLMRHKLATKLINNGFSRPVVSSILGHSNPTALDAYYDVNPQQSKKCAIDISQYPLNCLQYEEAGN